MVRQSDQEGALLLSNVSRPGNRRIRAPNQRTRLLILDDWAMIRLTAEQRRDLMEVIDDRHDRAATLLASQIPVSGWFDQIGDATYADALLDRVVHNAHRIELRGESMRKRILANTEEGTATPEPAT
jgi:DNA replication protein DnaC